jgi:pimeloyl-ACP methyl ester carboxylesterase
MRGSAHLAAVVVAAVLALTGCSDEKGSEASSAPTPEVDRTDALRDRCLSAIPEDAELEAFTFEGRTGGTIEAARIGPAASDTVAVLLPQISGMCGWGRWAHAAAGTAGVTSLLVNPCSYGDSTCPDDADSDPLNEVAPAVELAREQYGAKRVVLVGTSMGGSLTVIAAAAGAEVDGWVDVSGPSGWDGVELADLAPDLPPEGLVVMAPSDGEAEFSAAEDLALAAGVPFVAGRSGHGWELLTTLTGGRLTRIGARVMDFAVTGSRA